MALLEAVGLTAVLSGGEGPVRVLDGVDFALGAGELVDVSGPSGAGKTTLLRALARLLPGAEGRLSLEGRDASDWTPEAWRARVALLPQKPAMWPGTVGENLLVPYGLRSRHGSTPPDAAALARALGGVGLDDVALDRSAARLSLGQQARIALLRVTLTCPDVLLLDEPDASLDDASAEQVARMTADFVAEGGAAVRVRHARTDGLAARRLCLADGRLTEEGA